MGRSAGIEEEPQLLRRQHSIRYEDKTKKEPPKRLVPPLDTHTSLRHSDRSWVLRRGSWRPFLGRGLGLAARTQHERAGEWFPQLRDCKRMPGPAEKEGAMAGSDRGGGAGPP